MCVIIIKQKGYQVSKEVAKTSARINPHGLGIVWLDTFEVTYHKSAEYKLLDTDRPFIAHFRYATVGAIGRENTHPFVCGNNKNEYLMMNGTIKGLGNMKQSDSKVLANKLGGIPRPQWKSELAQYDCRFTTINVQSKSFQIYNREDWIQKDGVWYSKENVLEDNYVAVYGTLKKGYSNYWHYLSGTNFVGSGTTTDKYPLIVSGLPYLIEQKGLGHNVDVDVFKVTDSTLKSLDQLEGHPRWYCRKQINITIKGKQVLCWIYFNLKEVADNKVFHKSYVQAKPNYHSFGNYKSFNSFSTSSYTKRYDTIPAKAQPTKPVSKMFQDWFAEEVDEFDSKNETPMCVACYNDLAFDGFNNYHCSSCNTWYSEEDILRKF